MFVHLSNSGILEAFKDDNVSIFTTTGVSDCEYCELLHTHTKYSKADLHLCVMISPVSLGLGGLPVLCHMKVCIFVILSSNGILSLHNSFC